MSDHTTETPYQLMKRSYERIYIRGHTFVSSDLFLGGESMHLILYHIDLFVSLSRGNNIVKNVYLSPYTFYGQDDEVWNKVGQAIGNLEALETVSFSNYDNPRIYDGDDDQVVPTPDWRELALILSHIRQPVKAAVGSGSISSNDDNNVWSVGEVQALARAIHGHPAITSFGSGDNLPYEASDTFYSALATLPALESVRLSSSPKGIPLANPRSLTELLRLTSLRSIYFFEFYFTRALCEATANALMEGTAFTILEFNNCSFSAEGSAALMGNGLSRNTSVSHMRVHGPMQDDALFSALATALPSNSTLRCLVLQRLWNSEAWWYRALERPDHDLSRVYLGLGKNVGLKTLEVDSFVLCTGLIAGVGLNETLEHLKLKKVHLHDDIALWRRFTSFLRTNKTLKSLMVNVDQDVTEACLSAFRIDIASKLQDNASLESLSIHNYVEVVEADVYVALITLLQQNTTLKRLELNYNQMLQLTDDEDKRIAKILKKSYALESLPEISSLGDVSAILLLNAAGRRYLIENGSSVSKGVEVLSRVNSDINCVFFHLLENPTLCDRSAVEIASTDESNSSSSSRSTNVTVSSGAGKREQASVQKSRESRRRLA
jgi:hypothetical protein